ncbi:unnamed protein product, partial [Linum tenue]
GVRDGRDWDPPAVAAEELEPADAVLQHHGEEVWVLVWVGSDFLGLGGLEVVVS